jgi:hypothetical protein
VHTLEFEVVPRPRPARRRSDRARCIAAARASARIRRSGSSLSDGRRCSELVERPLPIYLGRGFDARVVDLELPVEVEEELGLDASRARLQEPCRTIEKRRWLRR